MIVRISSIRARTTSPEYALLGWQAPDRNATTGAPIADPTKFPSGMAAVADQVHLLGLKVKCRLLRLIRGRAYLF